MNKETQILFGKINKNTPKKFYKNVSDSIKSKIKFKLLTLTVIDKSLSFVERVYTSNSKIYPLLGIKSIPKNNWNKVVIKQKKNYILRTKNEIKKIYYDYEIIFSLGCGSIINYLVLFNGKHLGTINILHKEKYYKKKHIKDLENYSKLLIPFFINHQISMKKKK